MRFQLFVFVAFSAPLFAHNFETVRSYPCPRCHQMVQVLRCRDCGRTQEIHGHGRSGAQDVNEGDPNSLITPPSRRNEPEADSRPIAPPKPEQLRKTAYSFQYDIIDEKGVVRRKCQAALLPKLQEGVCLAVTASHCLEKPMLKAAMQGSLVGGDVPGFAVRFRGPGFEISDARGHINPTYIRDDDGDVAALSWKCPTLPDLPTVPLASRAVALGETVLYTKVMGSIGVYNGRAEKETIRLPDGRVTTIDGINGSSIGHKRIPVRQAPGHSTQDGDSGGPLLRRNPDGSVELVGVLSSRGADQTDYAYYETNESMAFIQKVKESLREKKK